ncbi:MAG TPA: peptidogalycan biosysnthesis protein, partial [Sphingomicrobium sp.]
MADRDADIVIRVAPGVGSLPAADWDRLAGADPFLGHAFLAGLEHSHSVGGGSGWSPAPLLVERDDHMIAAAPAYLKSHSQGEYVFDHGWADAWQRAGGQYYPKLQIAVPFTPVPGRRLLGIAGRQLLAGAEALVEQNGLSSAHVTFIDEAGAAECEQRNWLSRFGI